MIDLRKIWKHWTSSLSGLVWGEVVLKLTNRLATWQKAKGLKWDCETVAALLCTSVFCFHFYNLQRMQSGYVHGLLNRSLCSVDNSDCSFSGVILFPLSFRSLWLVLNICAIQLITQLDPWLYRRSFHKFVVRNTIKCPRFVDRLP